MKNQVVRALAALAIMISPVAARAHHSFAGQFDPNGSMELEGELIEIRWVNPHAYLTLRTIENGVEVDWKLETAGASQMVRSGVLPEYFSIGDHVRVAGWPPVTDAKEIHATNLLTPDGREVILFRGAAPRFEDEVTGSYDYARQRQGDASRPELGLFRIWSFTGLSGFLLPEDINANYDLERYPMTDAARRSVAAFDRALDNPTLNCTAKGMPMIMENPYPIEIARNGEDIRIRIEEYDLVRTVHMGESAPPANTPASPLGYSIGRWEGDTLVVETSRISWPWFDQVGIPQSDRSVLIERFTPTPDGSRMDYAVTVTDPVSFARPVELSRYFLDLGEEIMPYRCADND
jgi:Family of unknown function (DUF6152)